MGYWVPGIEYKINLLTTQYSLLTSIEAPYLPDCVSQAGFNGYPSDRRSSGRGIEVFKLFMITVYVLKSITNCSRYVGMTEDLDRRLKEHNAGKMKSTKAFKPWEVVYQEIVDSRAEGRKREKYLKSAAGRRYLQKMLAP